MTVRARRAAAAVFLATVVLAAAAAVAAFVMIYRYPDAPHDGAGGEVEVVLPRGARFDESVRRLEDANLIGSSTAFRLYASWRGQTHRVRAGTYRMRTDLSPRQILDALVRGARVRDVIVTIPEGKNLEDVAGLLADAGVGTRYALLARTRDATYARSLGIPAATMEGYLFPDTYRLRRGDAEAALRRLHARFREVFDRLARRHAAGLTALRRDLGFDEHDVVTLASIVEKETGRGGERPLVASVYLNRLRHPAFQSRLLEADPTIVYGCTVARVRSAACRRFSDRLRTAQLRDPDNPYNTYTRRGLPPGPIANPGRAALDAVLRPAQSEYLYFVSRNDGTHEFSRTFDEHQKAVDRYQRGRL